MRQLNSSVNDSAEPATTGPDLHRQHEARLSEKKHRYTDVYQNFRSKTTILECITAVSCEISGTNQSGKKQRTASPEQWEKS